MDTNKHRTLSLAIVASILSGGVLVPPSLSHAQTRVAAKQTFAKAASPLELEAKGAARQYLNAVYKKCGKSYYQYGYVDGTGDSTPIYLDAQGVARWKKAPRTTGDYDSGEVTLFNRHLTFWEYQGVSLSDLRVTSGPVSAADRLNGVEWRGTASAPPESIATRSRHSDGSGKNLIWSPWTEWSDASRYAFTVQLQKRQGRWYGNAGDKAVDELAPQIATCDVKTLYLPLD